MTHSGGRGSVTRAAQAGGADAAMYDGLAHGFIVKVANFGLAMEMNLCGRQVHGQRTGGKYYIAPVCTPSLQTVAPPVSRQTTSLQAVAPPVSRQTTPDSRGLSNAPIGAHAQVQQRSDCWAARIICQC